MVTSVMGNTPFVNGKNHPSFCSGKWDIAHIMDTPRKRQKKIRDRNLDKPLIVNLTRVLRERDLDNKYVSLKAGLGETYVSDILADRVANPTHAKLAKVASVLNVSVSQLLGEIEVDSIPVLGYVDADDRIYLPGCDLILMQSMSEIDLKDKAIELVTLAGMATGDGIAAVRLNDHEKSSLDPAGSLTCFKRTKILTSNFDIYLGKRVIAQLEDGTIYKRELDKGSIHGTYTLLDVAGRNHIKNIRLVAVVPVYSTVYPE